MPTKWICYRDFVAIFAADIIKTAYFLADRTNSHTYGTMLCLPVSYVLWLNGVSYWKAKEMACEESKGLVTNDVVSPREVKSWSQYA